MELDPAVVAAAAAEVARQEGRCDAKADSLSQFSGALASIMAIVAAGAGAIAVLVTHLGLWALLPILLLAGAAALWGSALLVLIYKVIRPDLSGPSDTAFVHPDHVHRLSGISLEAFYLDLVLRLRPLVVTRFRHLARAVDLIVAGFVALFAGATTFGVLLALTA
jgi:hypothetical protein